MKVLIIGGAGFFGYHLSKKYISLGKTVHIVDDLSRGKLDEDLSEILDCGQISLYNEDLYSFYKNKNYSKEYDLIYHFAAKVGVANVQNDPYGTLYNNINLTNIAVNIAREQKSLKRMIFTSTSEVYSGAVEINIANIPTIENTALIINNIKEERATYKLSKIVGESMLLNSNLPVSIVRPHNIYGPRMGMAHVIPELIFKISQLKDGGALGVYSMNHTRTFCYIEDAINMIMQIATSKNTLNKILNLGAESPEIKMCNLAKKIIKLTKKKLDIVADIDHPGSPIRRCPDMSETLKNINYSYQVDLESGLSKTFNWYIKHLY
jgi:nucleoside-diphosphate-sugar epimerase